MLTHDECMVEMRMLVITMVVNVVMVLVARMVAMFERGWW